MWELGWRVGVCFHDAGVLGVCARSLRGCLSVFGFVRPFLAGAFVFGGGCPRGGGCLWIPGRGPLLFGWLSSGWWVFHVPVFYAGSDTYPVQAAGGFNGHHHRRESCQSACSPSIS